MLIKRDDTPRIVRGNHVKYRCDRCRRFRDLSAWSIEGSSRTLCGQCVEFERDELIALREAKK